MREETNNGPLGLDEMRSAVAAQIGVEESAVGDGSDLIELGLDSMAMMTLATRWRYRGVEVSLRELYENPTLLGWYELASRSREEAGAGGSDR
ncbi:phosphopantetheine-binding protein [Streptomyces albidus (ex Kaewkla and Franco 2022)]|uniref:phosphopantetheine-binding protein n=1 Tax=Streptomyces albidus (ex Kaewkla and Franco 2022) TaxID=722709 RepID=UPI0015EE8EFE|nr:phosphopantetheine-binding protein [Streptomyces albidus (ex Kaewkla and Franco 2022)]